MFAFDAQAGFHHGNDIYTMCQNNQAEVFGYVAGWVDKQTIDDDLLDLTLIQTAQNKDVGFAKFRMGGNICYPKGMILRQARDVFCHILRRTPANVTKTADTLYAWLLARRGPANSWRVNGA
ncbi:Rap1a/Tai family immunity protein [Rhizobium ruizarguesonis]|uniref:Rap1a/Tai family immunity protein n=1 Tax=Rhizobium ruizarguesonis TaxID=2081791 RepID=UPI0037CC4C7B